VNRLNNLNVDYMKIPKLIAGRTKCSRGPHAARVFDTLVYPLLEKQL